MTPRRRLGGALLLAGALGLAGLGQFYFLHRPEYRWDGLAFFVLAVVCFWAAARRLEPAHATARRLHLPGLETWLASHWIRIGLAGLGTGAVAVVTTVSASRAWGDACGDLLVMWVGGIALTVGAIVWPGRADWARAGSRLRQVVSWEWAVVAVLTLAAFGLRAWALGSVPYTLGGDEGTHGMLALDVIAGRLGHPFQMGTMSMPTLYYWPLAGSLLLFGDNVLGLRILSAFVGALTIPIWYALARQIWDRRLALASTAFLAAYHYHIHYSRLAANNILDPFLAVAVVWALDRGLQTGRLRPFAWAGLGLGLAIYGYTGARVLPWLLTAYVGWVWLTQARRPQGVARGLVVLILVTVVTAAPMLGYAWAHPNEWNARINQVGILQSGWLAREPGLTGKSTAAILAEQFLRAAGAFHAFPDRTVWYGLREPLLGAAAGAFLLLGMAYAASRWRARGSFLVLGWFWAVIIAGGMLTESPPSSQRLVLAIPPVALLVALGAERTVALAARVLGATQRARQLALATAMLALCAFSIRTYVWRYTPQRIYGGENGRVATRLAIHLGQRADDAQVYFFGPPRIYYSFGAIRFLAQDAPGLDVVDALQGPPDFVDPARRAIFVFLPEREGELAWVKDAYPGGQQTWFRTGERTDFVTYTVNPAAASP